MTTWEYLKTWTNDGETVKDYKKVKMVLQEANKLLTKARNNGIMMESVKGFREETAQVSGYL